MVLENRHRMHQWLTGYCYDIHFYLQPAYNKDDFFDNISCNSVGRGARNGQNGLPERVKLNSEVRLGKPFLFLFFGLWAPVFTNAYNISLSFMHTSDIWQ